MRNRFPGTSLGRSSGLCLIALLSVPAFAQSYEEKFEQKMAKPFVKNAAWETDWDKAREKAAAENKLILGYFTRSFRP